MRNDAALIKSAGHVLHYPCWPLALSTQSTTICYHHTRKQLSISTLSLRHALLYYQSMVQLPIFPYPTILEAFRLSCLSIQHRMHDHGATEGIRLGPRDVRTLSFSSLIWLSRSFTILILILYHNKLCASFICSSHTNSFRRKSISLILVKQFCLTTDRLVSMWFFEQPRHESRNTKEVQLVDIVRKC